MMTTKLATACGAVLLGAGLTLGVGWVSAGGPGTEPATASATPDPQPEKAQPPKKDTPPDPPALVEWRRRIEKLQEQSRQIAERVNAAQARLARTEPEPENVDVAALQSELFALDKDILNQESNATLRAGYLEGAIKAQEEDPKLPLQERDLAERIEADQQVREGTDRVRKAKALVETLRKSVAADSPVLQAAAKDLSDAEDGLKAAREKARPAAERAIRTWRADRLAESVIVNKSQVAGVAAQLAELRKKRQHLVTRIAKAREQDARRQVFQDELRVLREIQMEVMRQQTLAELGIEALPPARVRPEADPQVEAQLRDLRREIEVLRAEVEKLRGEK